MCKTIKWPLFGQGKDWVLIIDIWGTPTINRLQWPMKVIEIFRKLHFLILKHLFYSSFNSLNPPPPPQIKCFVGAVVCCLTNKTINIIFGKGGRCFQDAKILLPSVSILSSLIVEIPLALMRTQLGLCSWATHATDVAWLVFDIVAQWMHPDLTISTLYPVNGILFSARWVFLKAESTNIRFNFLQFLGYGVRKNSLFSSYPCFSFCRKETWLFFCLFVRRKGFGF